ncbi:hypothetical protein B0J12DRAFT_738049 [Macrophomina phaseolina]|nr:hypothetical protein B0J12DRAFT_738049 [Macrophomina phaseolina]
MATSHAMTPDAESPHPSSSSSSNCPPLPFELWVRIVASITNSNLIPHVWLSCRRVSRLLRAATEEAFLIRHLKPRTRITFGDLGMVRDRRGKKVYLKLVLAFDRLAEGDRGRAVFRDAKVDAKVRGRGVEEALVERWKDAMRLYRGGGDGDGRIDLPPYTVAVRQVVNDSELPGLEVDYERREVSFDWRGMFDMLFGEEMYAMRLNYATRKLPGGSKANDIQGMIKTGKIELFSGISQMMRVISERERLAYRDARRVRIKRWYKKHENHELRKDHFDADYQEKQKLKELRIARKYIDYSDESEDDDLPDEDKEAFDQGFGFTRFDVGDPHNEDPFVDWTRAQDSDSEYEDPFEEFLGYSQQVMQLNEREGDGDSSDSSLDSYSESIDSVGEEH